MREEKVDISELQKIIKYSFKDLTLLETSITHPSCRGFKKDIMPHNRLEFLGDRVLGLVIADLLYNMYDDYDEGRLSNMQANCINSDALHKIAVSISLSNFIKMKRGEEKCGGRDNPNNLEDTMEALIAAIYLDGGYYEAKKVISHLWKDTIADHTNLIKRNYKSLLQEKVQKSENGIPEYELIENLGSDHDPEFLVKVLCGKHGISYGKGRTIKKAEQEAAACMLEKMEKDLQGKDKDKKDDRDERDNRD